MERIKGWVDATRTYLREVAGELAKTSWPNMEVLTKHTGIVIVMVAVITAFMFACDWPMNLGLAKLIGQ